MATTVFRVEKNREFVVMNNKFLRNGEMSLKAKGLLALCLSLPDNWNYSINGLVSICKESQTAIRSTLKELEEFNHLKRNRLKDEKGQFYYEYVLYEVPYAGFEDTDIRIAGSANTGNRRLQSTKKKSIKKINNNNKSNDLKRQLEEFYKPRH